MPGRPVDDAAREGAVVSDAGGGVAHRAVAVGVGLGQMHEHVVVRARRVSRFALRWERPQDNS